MAYKTFTDKYGFEAITDNKRREKVEKAKRLLEALTNKYLTEHGLWSKYCLNYDKIDGLTYPALDGRIACKEYVEDQKKKIFIPTGSLWHPSFYSSQEKSMYFSLYLQFSPITPFKFEDGNWCWQYVEDALNDNTTSLYASGNDDFAMTTTRMSLLRAFNTLREIVKTSPHTHESLKTHWGFVCA